MSDSKVREDAYDAWTRTVGVSNAPGGNLAMSPLDAWRAAWQASRAAALEEAAKVCGVCAIMAYERMAAQYHPEDSDRWEAMGDWATECANAIRALAGRGA